MVDLKTTLTHCFEQSFSNSWGAMDREGPIEKSSFMVVPISEDAFTVPIFALSSFMNNLTCDNIGEAKTLAVNLYNLGYKASYKSLDSNIRSTFKIAFSHSHLIKLASYSPSQTFYSTYGAIFDKDFQPIMMLLWQLEKIPQDEGDWPLKYTFVKPMLWIAPKVFVNKDTAVERYIINKILPTILDINYIARPRIISDRIRKFIYPSDRGYIDTVKVEIDKCPYKFKETDVPSISTTNENLLKVALDNIEEVVQ
jgi:hypothetical protein